MQEPETEEASMWTRKDLNEFKDMIRKEESDAIIKVCYPLDLQCPNGKCYKV